MKVDLKMSETETTDLALVDETSALAVLQDPEKFDAFYSRVKAQTDTLVPDLTTLRGRKEIASMARRVVKTKTFIDAQRKILTEDARKIIDAADRAGKLIRDKLDALRDEVRAPLTEWEEAEEARVEAVKSILAAFQSAATVDPEETSQDVSSRLAAMKSRVPDPEVFKDYISIAEAHWTQSIESLEAAVVRLQKSEQDARELAALRAAEEERQRAETERQEREEQERIYREAEENREREAAQEQERQEQAERDRVERERLAREQAAENAREEERQRLEKENQALLDAERERAESEKRRAEELQRKEDQRIAEEAKERAASEARQKDRAHKSAMMAAAKDAIISVAENGNSDLEPGRIENIAIQIVRAIVAGEIPSVTLTF